MITESSAPMADSGTTLTSWPALRNVRTTEKSQPSSVRKCIGQVRFDDTLAHETNFELTKRRVSKERISSTSHLASAKRPETTKFAAV